MRRSPSVHAAGQRGASMLFALLAMVALMFAAVALVRAVHGGTLVIGNLGFKQTATAYADQAAEAAIAWLSAKVDGATLNGDQVLEGYYATSFQELDPTNRSPGVVTRAVVDWAGDKCGPDSYAAGSFTACLQPKKSVEANGNTTKYVITRLCSAALPQADSANVCAAPLDNGTSVSPSKGAVDYQNSPRFGMARSGPYFRILVRTSGARNTASVVETIVHY